MNIIGNRKYSQSLVVILALAIWGCGSDSDHNDDAEVTPDQVESTNSDVNTGGGEAPKSAPQPPVTKKTTKKPSGKRPILIESQKKQADGPETDGTDKVEIIEKELPEWVDVTQIELAGTGCPAGTAELTYLYDGENFELQADQFEVASGPGVSRRESRKVCSILFALDYPEGWQFSYQSIESLVDLDIGGDHKGLVKTSGHIQGDPLTDTYESSFEGPMFETKAVLHTLESLWSPCSERRASVLKLEMRLSSDVEGERVESRMILSNPTTISLQWRKCPLELN
jgi:hypothetical protein